MSAKARSPRSGDARLDRELQEMLDQLGVQRDRDVLFDILASAVRLATDNADRLDLKITSATLKEMRAAFRAFAPYRDVPKITIFGSARTLPTDPSYAQARDLAQHMASQGWMVVTGAGPGIMAAGLEGAGRDHAFGVNIRLPFEQSANAFIAGDEKLISMKYFFTRKLMLMKESLGFVSLPGGFGTLDETMELLTLIQTGKASPAPVVLLDEPRGTFWSGFADFLRADVVTRRLIDEDDLDLFLCTDDVSTAADVVIGFYRNYHSLRWVGDQLVLRLHRGPTDEQLADLATRFGAISTDGRIERCDPFPAEQRDGDQLELA
ncbi:MAG TPA: TIGR00730 family Rossman fold protein, partial [Acidimicrobiales bacterium]|nr:TIGR00730 family Rossman fold protein [Acidimicrobiales bacterium]